jgi:glycine betaine/proline transport system substrate-binding protein
MLAEVEGRYRMKEEFVFVAWEPHWLNEAYELDYLEDPKGALGTLTEPSDVSTLVREGLAEDETPLPTPSWTAWSSPRPRSPGCRRI